MYMQRLDGLLYSFAIFNVKEWDKLPQSYLEFAYLKMLTDDRNKSNDDTYFTNTIASHLNSTGTTPLDSEIQPQEPDESDLVG